MRLYYVYILASIRRVLSIGLTGNFEQRLAEHRAHKYPDSFTARFDVTRLVYCEEFTRVEDAITREKQLKGWRRGKKVRLIESLNPAWEDLAPPGLPGPSLTLGMTGGS